MFNDIIEKYNGEDAVVRDNFDYFFEVIEKSKFDHLQDEIQKLATYLQTEFGDRIGETGSLGAADEAIRLLKDYKKS